MYEPERDRADHTEPILAACIEVHRALGPGLLESAYEECLAYELLSRGHAVVRQRAVPLAYKELRIACAYRLDLVVDERVIIEVKCVERWLPVHVAQMVTYLRLTGLRVGLLLNFRVPALREGVRRVVR